MNPSKKKMPEKAVEFRSWLRLRFGFCAGISSKKSWPLIGSNEIPCIAAPNQIRCCINPLVCCPLPLSGAGNDSLQRRKGREDAPTKRATGLLHSNSRRGGETLLDFFYFIFFKKRRRNTSAWNPAGTFLLKKRKADDS